ncbi:MAG TPA: YicC/YloC family endoribonuclease, partial [Spirochaetia bacterium]|nr:YicC/YloC family endoribonuclease [Spirochaetia bacterium]
MTGFAFGEANAGPIRVTAELKSYNNRYLDLILGLPPPLASWEPALRDTLAGAIARGRVEFTVRLKEGVEATAVEVNEALALQYTRAFAALKKATGA